MDPLSITVSAISLAQITAHLIKVTNNYVNGVKSAPSEVPALGAELKLLEQNIQALAAHLKTLETENSGIPDTLEKRLQEPIEACKNELEALNEVLEKRMVKGKSWLRKFGKQLKWPLKSQETMDVIQRLKRYESAFVLAIGVETSGVTRVIRQDIAAIKTAQQQSAEDKKRAAREKKFRDVVEWLAPDDVDPLLNYHAARKLQQPGTGQWFTDSTIFTEWKAKPKSFLWLYGAAGSGKTILSSYVLETLIQAAQPDSQPIFFYCDFRDEQKTKWLNICRSLSAQILKAHCTELPQELEERYDNRASSGALYEQEIKEIFHLLARQAKKLTILVDALDECKERVEFLETMKTAQSVCDINFLFTSREELDIKEEVGDWPKIHISPEAVDDDIKLFIREEIIRHPRLRKLKPALKADIQTTVTAGANGMFRWAACQLETIASKRLDRDIRAALTQLPANLEETYEQILAGISESDRDIAIRVLNWLVCSFRPMLIGEVVEAIAIELDTGSIDPEYKLEHPEELLEICRSLVIMDTTNQSISLAHFSVKEFLMKKRGGDNFFWVPKERNYTLVKYCMTYMCFDEFKIGPSLRYLEQYQKYPFYEYATEFWMKHAYGHNDIRDTGYMRHIASFLDSPSPEKSTTGAFDSWLQCYTRPKSKKPPQSVTDLNFYFPCLFGLESAVEMLLAKGHDPKGSDGEHLIAAARSGNIGVIKLLLDAGAEINHVSDQKDTAICAAIRHDNIPALQYLISRGGDVMLGSPSPLMTAINRNSATAVEICIAAGADVLENSANDDTSNPLGASIFSRGKAGKDIFGMIVEHGAAASYFKLSGQTIPTNNDVMDLSLLVQKNCVQQAKKILDADAARGVKIADGDLEYLFIKNTVYFAIKRGFARFLEMMLLHLGPKFKDYTRVLEIASLRGTTLTLKAALGAWKAAGGTESLGDSLLISTVQESYEKVSLLLEYGADPEKAAANGWSPLRFAIANEKVEIVDVFRQHGVQSTEAALGEDPEGPTEWTYSSPWLPPDLDLSWPHTPKGVEITGGKVTLAANAARSGLLLHGNKPITATSGLYSISVSITSAPPTENQQIHIGLCSYLPVYDPDGAILDAPGAHPLTMSYSSNGALLTYKHRDVEFGPQFTVGDTVRCIWDIEQSRAWFTVNGKRVGKAVKNVTGLLTPVVHLKPGTEVTAEFGGVVEGCLVDLGREVDTDDTDLDFERRDPNERSNRFHDMLGEDEPDV